MSAISGISVSQELSTAFNHAIESDQVRFIKVSIQNESLVPTDTISPSGSLNEDLDRLGDVLEDDIPAYILVKLDEPPTEWLAISYVPDSAKVRDKMLYASTRNNLTKALGSAHFTDTLFATNKSDVTSDAYTKHRQHLAAPKPMSEREKEMEEVKAAERQAGGGSYEGGRMRRNHLGTVVGFPWSDDAQEALQDLLGDEESRLVILTVDPATESLLSSSVKVVTVDQLGSAIPISEPCYAFFAWPQEITTPPRRDIIFIYSCPSTSPVKNRMLYSSGARAVFHSAKGLLGEGAPLLERKIETSDPKELDANYLKAELGLSSTPSGNHGTSTPITNGETKSFARPRGPPRRH